MGFDIHLIANFAALALITIAGPSHLHPLLPPRRTLTPVVWAKPRS